MPARKFGILSTRGSRPSLAIGVSTESVSRHGRVDFGAPPGLVDSRRVPPLHPGQFTSTLRHEGEEHSQPDTTDDGVGWGIVIATSLPAFATGLEAWLMNATGGWVVRATCQTAPEAIDAATHAPPVVVVATDELDGVAVGRDLRIAVRSALLLVLTADGNPVREAALMRAGASGVLAMSAPRREVLRAVGDVIAGWCVVSAAGVRCLVDEGAAPGAPGITARQRQVLELLADGLSTAQIAERLVVTPSTVKTHLTRLSGRFGLAGQRALAVKAPALLAAGGVGDAMPSRAPDGRGDGGGVGWETTSSSAAGRW